MKAIEAVAELVAPERFTNTPHENTEWMTVLEKNDLKKFDALIKAKNLDINTLFPHFFVEKLLLSGGTPTRCTPLGLGIRNDEKKTVQWMLDHGANPNAICLENSSGSMLPLALAVFNSKDSLVKLLLERGASPKQTCILEGAETTPLQIAQKKAESKKSTNVKILTLLQAGAK